MLKRIILVGVAFGIFLTQVHAKNYYKWVDSKGNVSYSSKPPPAGAKQQKIETLRSLGSTQSTSPQKREFKSNASIPNQYHSPYQSGNKTTYKPPREHEDETLQQKTIPGGSSYSAPMPQRSPSVITNCDDSGCWGSDGTRYNKGAGNTYFPSTGGSCQNIGGQMQCN
jgi:hypothetical protein